MQLDRGGFERGHGTFSSEADLMWPLAAEAAVLGKPSGLVASERTSFFEVAAAAGVPDMLIVEFDTEAIDRRVTAGLGPVVAATAARALWTLAGRTLSAGEIAGELTMTVGHVRRSVLPEMADAGLVVPVEDGRWTASDAVAPLVRSVVAVEAKLRDWRGGFKQARRYTRFANQSYLAMDARHARLATHHADDMANAKVGLVTVDAADGSVQVLRRPRWQNPAVPWEFFVVGERVCDLALAGSRSGPTFDVFGRTPAPTPDMAPGATRCGLGRRAQLAT